jgi:pyruvate dehydrogenase E1 component alpha subunit
LSDHTTADDASRYRSETEVTEAWKVEPLIRLRKLLEARGVLDEAREQTMKAQFAREVDEAVQEYQNTPRQNTDAMFAHLYANLPRSLEAQKEIARRYAGTGRSSH